MHEKLWAADKSFIVDYQTRTENVTADQVAAAERAFGNKDLPNILNLNGSTATIDIKGVLTRTGPSWIDRFFGFDGTAYGKIIDSIKAILDDDSIKDVKLIIDSPGGEVAGVDEVFQSFVSLGKKKNVIAENHGMIASAAYWIASSAKKIIATSPVVSTGSIGVIITAVDYSKAQERYGIKVVRIVSKNAPNKAPTVNNKSGRDLLQDRVDAIERVFIKRVAEGRNKTAHDVIANFGKGGLLIAEDPDKSNPDAISVGMIDSVVPFKIESNKEQTEDDNNDFFASNIATPGVAVAIHSNKDNPQAQAGAKTKPEGQYMSLKKLLEENPAAAAEYQNEITAAKAEGNKEGEATIKAHIEKCANFIGNEKYNKKGFQGLVKKALTGESSFAAIEGAVAVMDLDAEEKASTEAKTETKKQPETKPETQELPKGGEGEFQQTIAQDKAALGLD